MLHTTDHAAAQACTNDPKPHHLDWPGFLSMALLAGLFWAGYWHVTGNDWRLDDPDHLTSASRLGLFGLYRLFVDRDIWGLISRVNFCPINVAVYGFWLKLFGPHPGPAYVLHLFNLFLLALAYFAWLLRYVRLPVALGFTVLCFASLPVYELANELMSNHYALAGLFAVLALHAFDEAPRRGWPFWLAGALLAALAALSKEIFGFVVLYPLLRELLAAPPVWHDRDDLRQRLGPPLLAMLPMAGFALWRRAMLGDRLGGYGYFATGDIGKALQYVFGDHVALAGAGLALGLLLLGLNRGWRPILAAGLMTLYGAIPSLFIPTMASGRYWFLPLLSLCYFLALAWPTDFRQRGRAAAALLASLLVAGPLLAHTRLRGPQVHAAFTAQGREMRNLVDQLKSQPLRVEITDKQNAQKLRRAKKLCVVEQGGTPGPTCQGELVLGGRPIEPLRDIAALEQVCDSLGATGWTCRDRSRLDITTDYRDSVLLWNHQPCATGMATIIYKPDPGFTQFYNGLDDRKDWLVSILPCHPDQFIKLYGLKWLDMMVVMDEADGSKLITPLRHLDLGRPHDEQTLEALRVAPPARP
jgi:hypothetical protein